MIFGRKEKFEIKTFEQFLKMRKAGLVVADTLSRIAKEAGPGVTTADLDRIAREELHRFGATPSFLGYHGYPAVICSSVNDEVVHAIPNERPLKDGDILSVDFGAIVDGWHGDSSRMYGVGHVPRRAERLVDITYECLMRGIAAVKPGATTGDIGQAIQTYAESERCSTFRVSFHKSAW